MIPVQVGSKKFEIPSSWNELSLKQLFAYINLVYLKHDEIFRTHENKNGEKRISIRSWKVYHSSRVSLLFFILGLPYAQFIRIDAAHVRWMISQCKLTDFFFEKLSLTKNLLVSFRHSPLLGRYGRKYYGPSDNFDNLVALEFFFAHRYYMQYKSESGERKSEALNIFFAILWREGQKDWEGKGDRRAPFNNHLVDKRAKRFRSIDIKYKLAAVLWFESCLDKLAEKYPFVFTRERKKEMDRHGAMKVLLGMSGPKFGTPEMVYRTDLHTFMTEMDIVAEEGEKMRERMRKKRIS